MGHDEKQTVSISRLDPRSSPEPVGSKQSAGSGYLSNQNQIPDNINICNRTASAVGLHDAGLHVRDCYNGHPAKYMRDSLHRADCPRSSVKPTISLCYQVSIRGVANTCQRQNLSGALIKAD